MKPICTTSAKQVKKLKLIWEDKFLLAQTDAPFNTNNTANEHMTSRETRPDVWRGVRLCYVYTTEFTVVTLSLFHTTATRFH